MDGFSFLLPHTNLIFGEGSLDKLGKNAAALGKNALLVAGGSSMKRLGFLDKAKASLEDSGIRVSLFEGIEPNPSSETVASGITKGLDSGCDFVVAVGGGSAIDAAKLIAVGIGHDDSDAWPFVCGFKETTRKTLPLAAIPSTSGTGSHLTWYTVITNRETREKAAYSSPHIFPRLSIVDLDIVSTMPKKVTAETGFDALAHVMEAYVSKRANPISDMLCLRAMELISQNLARAFNIGDRDSRHAMALADSYAGICITSSRTIMVHGIGNTISGVYPELAHGQALACITPAVMEFNIRKSDAKTVAKYCDIAGALGENAGCGKDGAMRSVDAVRRIITSLGLESRLACCGVDEGDLELIAEYSEKLGSGAIACNPVAVKKQDITDVLKGSL
jgi:alcohol dehydrogenase